MSDHDPLCPHEDYEVEGAWLSTMCRCDLIAKVRADEREQITASLEAQHLSGVSAAVKSARADERERIARAIDRLREVAEVRWRNEQHVYWEGARDAHADAARIARRQR